MRSRITTIEWLLLICGAAALDLAQFILDFTLIGEALNPEIDMVVGPALGFYFKYRGVTVDKSKLAVWILAPIWEFFTDGFLPIGWVSEVALTMWLDKRAPASA